MPHSMRSTSNHLEYGVYYFFEYFGLYMHSHVWNVRTCFGRPCSRIKVGSRSTGNEI